MPTTTSVAQTSRTGRAVGATGRRRDPSWIGRRSLGAPATRAPRARVAP
jgi:hypothetical protein